MKSMTHMVRVFAVTCFAVLYIMLMTSDVSPSPLMLVVTATGETARDMASGDIDGDGQKEVIVLLAQHGAEYGDNVLIYSTVSSSIIRMVPFAQLNPWKVACGDVDGDRQAEISVGVYKTTPYHPVMAKRPFFYAWEGGRDGKLVPKWLGSRLSRPFTDYKLEDIDGDGCDELVADEVLQDGSKGKGLYKWKGFGFERF